MLTTLGKAKLLLQISADDTSQDLLLEALLMASSVAIEDWCKRSFGYQEYINGKYDGIRGSYLLLPNYPIHSVSLLKLGTEIEAEGSFEIVSDKGMIYRSCGWPCGERRIAVSYTAGYILPGDDPAEGIPSLPEPLELACILFAQTLQRQPGVSAERVGDISVTYANEGEGLPFAVKALINPYRRWV